MGVREVDNCHIFGWSGGAVRTDVSSAWSVPLLYVLGWKGNSESGASVRTDGDIAPVLLNYILGD